MHNNIIKSIILETGDREIKFLINLTNSGQISVKSGIPPKSCCTCIFSIFINNNYVYALSIDDWNRETVDNKDSMWVGCLPAEIHKFIGAQIIESNVSKQIFSNKKRAQYYLKILTNIGELQLVPDLVHCKRCKSKTLAKVEYTIHGILTKKYVPW